MTLAERTTINLSVWTRPFDLDTERFLGAKVDFSSTLDEGTFFFVRNPKGQLDPANRHGEMPAPAPQ